MNISCNYPLIISCFPIIYTFLVPEKRLCSGPFVLESHKGKQGLETTAGQQDQNYCDCLQSPCNLVVFKMVAPKQGPSLPNNSGVSGQR